MEDTDSYILIAGGTGLLGRAITGLLRQDGKRVRILTRGKTDKNEGLYHWNPEKSEIDSEALENVSVIINLSGAGIADKRWTKKRRREIIDSRVGPTSFLYQQAKQLSGLEQYITASGINCYGFEEPERLHVESDPFGTDFLSEVVKRWETAADQFSTICRVAKIRISTVLSPDGGALSVMARPVKLGFGSPLGKGTQNMPWIHIEDVAGIFEWAVEQQLDGAYNAVAGNTSNREFMHTLANALRRPYWAPRVPAGLLRIAMGELSDLALKGVKADNSKIRQTGFRFKYEQLDRALEAIYCC